MEAGASLTRPWSENVASSRTSLGSFPGAVTSAPVLTTAAVLLPGALGARVAARRLRTMMGP